MDANCGGYNAKIFVSDPPAEYDCSVCLQTLKNPMSCKNGHCSCFTCISSALNVNKACPVCKISLTPETLTKNLVAEQMIDKLPSYCVTKQSLSSSSDNCGWIGPLHARKNHYENNCDFYPVKCENIGCDVVSLRKDFNDHKSKCVFLRAVCEYCYNINSQEYLRSELKQHILVCEYRPVTCPNNCDEMIPLNELQSHIDRFCPKTIVECPVCIHESCPGKAERGDMMKHVLDGKTIFEKISEMAYAFSTTMHEHLVNKDVEIEALQMKLNNTEVEMQKMKERNLVLEEIISYYERLQLAADNKAADLITESSTVYSPTATNNEAQQQPLKEAGSSASELPPISLLSVRGNAQNEEKIMEVDIGGSEQKISKNSKKNAKKAAKRKNPPAKSSNYGPNSVITPAIVAIMEDAKNFKFPADCTTERHESSVHSFYTNILLPKVSAQFQTKWFENGDCDAQDVNDFFNFSAHYFTEFTSEHFIDVVKQFLSNGEMSFKRFFNMYANLEGFNHDAMKQHTAMIIQAFIDNYRSKFLHWFNEVTDKVGEEDYTGGWCYYIESFQNLVSFNADFEMNNKEFEILRNAVITLSGTTTSSGINGSYTYFEESTENDKYADGFAICGYFAQQEHHYPRILCSIDDGLRHWTLCESDQHDFLTEYCVSSDLLEILPQGNVRWHNSVDNSWIVSKTERCLR